MKVVGLIKWPETKTPLTESFFNFLLWLNGIFDFFQIVMNFIWTDLDVLHNPRSSFDCFWDLPNTERYYYNSQNDKLSVFDIPFSLIRNQLYCSTLPLLCSEVTCIFLCSQWSASVPLHALEQLSCVQTLEMPTLISLTYKRKIKSHTWIQSVWPFTEKIKLNYIFQVYDQELESVTFHNVGPSLRVDFGASLWCLASAERHSLELRYWEVLILKRTLWHPAKNKYVGFRHYA